MVAPVYGGTVGAAHATLSIMAGGARADAVVRLDRDRRVVDVDTNGGPER